MHINLSFLPLTAWPWGDGSRVWKAGSHCANLRGGLQQKGGNLQHCREGRGAGAHPKAYPEALEFQRGQENKRSGIVHKSCRPLESSPTFCCFQDRAESGTSDTTATLIIFWKALAYHTPLPSWLFRIPTPKELLPLSFPNSTQTTLRTVETFYCKEYGSAPSKQPVCPESQ